MSMYSAFLSGISGMRATSQAIAASSDNITNSNAIGYKAANTYFSTMVTQASTKNHYTSGGVEIVNRRLVDMQGMLQSTGVVSDIAVAGKGMFVVNSRNTGDGEFLFTRAGSFRQDALGNFVNSADMTLMAWPLDNEGRIPGAPGNLNAISSALLDSLEPVNLRSLSGAVAATTSVKYSINLDSAEKTLEGAGQTISITSASMQNSTIGLEDIIAPNNNLTYGASLRINDGVSTYEYVYGGISESNNIVAGIMGATNPTQVFNAGVTNGDKFIISNPEIGNLTFTFTTSSPDTTQGHFNNLATLAQAINAAPGLNARIQNNRLYVSPEDANQTLTFTEVGAGNLVANLGFSDIGAPGPNISNSGVSTSEDITVTNMFGSNDPAVPFIAGVNPGDSFDITTPSLGTVSFVYNDPPAGGEFNSLSSLAAVINAHPGFRASISENRLSIVPTNTEDTMTFGFTGVTDFPTEFNMVDTTVLPGNVSRFSTLGGLQKMINTSTSIEAKLVTSGVTSARLKIFSKDPLGRMSYDYGYQVPSNNNILSEFSLIRNVPVPLTNATDLAKGIPLIDPTGPAYDPLGNDAGNMAGGEVVPHFSRNFEIYDPLGTRHDFRISFIKVDTNVWATEIYALYPDEIVSPTGRDDGLIVYGNITFNGDGSLRDLSPSLSDPINIAWTNGALSNNVSLFLGTAGLPVGTPGATTIGLKDGLTQIRSDYNVQFVDQNGVSAALLSSIDIDEDGYIIANYKNGLSQKLFKIPLADFPNPNGLLERDGNVFAARQEAGAFNLREANTGGVGNIKSSALEQANVELADELTKLIIAQRGYEADTQIIRSVNEMLKDLGRLFV